MATLYLEDGRYVHAIHCTTQHQVFEVLERMPDGESFAVIDEDMFALFEEHMIDFHQTLESFKETMRRDGRL